MNRNNFLLCAMLATVSTLGTAGHAFAQDNTLDLKSTFQGNQEQPRVMYIVPWQAIQAPPASYRPVSSLISENFQLVDREEFQRNVHFSDRIEQAQRDEQDRFQRYQSSME
ncbi:MAG: hypothetical protein WBN40_04630 [Pseudomonadales bacterium]